jgi:hypothetical protein
MYAKWTAAGPKTYYPNSTNCSATKGYSSTVGGSTVPASLACFESPVDITGDDLTYISTDDDNSVLQNQTGTSNGQRIKFKITEDVGTITKIDITLKGWGYRFTFEYGWWAFIYDDTGGHWDASIDNHTTASKDTLTYSLTTNIADFIDADGYFYVCVKSPLAMGVTDGSYLYFAKIEVYQ